MNERARNVTARDIMSPTLNTIPASASLEEAMQRLVQLRADTSTPNVLIVVDEHDRFEGILTARLLLKSLLALWSPSRAVLEDDARLEEELLQVARERSSITVHDAHVRGLPTASPDDRVLTLIAMCTDQRLEFIPVLEDRAPIGLVPVTSVLQAAASLALTPEDEGIRMGNDGVK